jgi:hypothetical protein
MEIVNYRNLCKVQVRILDIALETIPAKIAMLMNFDKTNFFSSHPPLQFNVVTSTETTFGNLP